MTTDFEIAVLGGGISGLAVALEAARQGKRVCLIEKDECGLATSNNSLRIIHGGLRYLQKLDFTRILTSVRDQTSCLKRWPDLIKPLTCVAPLNGKGLKRTNLARIATVMYSSFLGALDSPLERPYVDSRKSHSELPFLDGLASDGFLVWQDALLLDHRLLVRALLLELKQLGVEIFEFTKITAVRNIGSAVQIVCEQNGAEILISSNLAVNCMGAWIGELSDALPDKWCHAFNIILKKQFNPDLAFGCDGERGRYFFFVPRKDKTVLGTGYAEYIKTVNAAALLDTKVEEFINSAARAAPKLELSVSDIESIESGILPMKGLGSNGEPALYGSGQITRIGNVVHVLSTKYTTFRSQAREVLKLLN